jgi:hypothetical protein
MNACSRFLQGATLLLSIGLAAAALSAEPQTFKVKYRSATTVYLDGGSSRGLAVGDRVSVVADGKTVAELELVYVAEQSSSARIVSEQRPVQAGDSVISTKATATPATAPTPAATPAPAEDKPAPSAPPAATYGAPQPAAERPWARLRGSAAFTYSKSDDRTAANLDFEQRRARVDLVLSDIGGQPLTVNLRLRSSDERRAHDLSPLVPQSERTDRLYEASLSYDPPSGRLSIEAGRIGVSRFSGVGYLDGGLARFEVRPGIQLGAFAGRVADIDGLDLKGLGAKYGALLRLGPTGRFATGSYEVLAVAVHESAEGDVSREYLGLESRFRAGSRFSFFERAEIDINRGWRKEISGRALQLSNLALSSQLRLSTFSSASLSYDNRRTYRTYENRSIPEQEFDDRVRQGLRAGITLGRPSGLRAYASAGARFTQSVDRQTYSFSGGLGSDGLFGHSVAVGIDGAGYTNALTQGLLASVRAGKFLAHGHSVDVTIGRSQYRARTTGGTHATNWARISGRGELGRGLYSVADLEYDHGDDVDGPRGFLELGCRF